MRLGKKNLIDSKYLIMWLNLGAASLVWTQWSVAEKLSVELCKWETANSCV